MKHAAPIRPEIVLVRLFYPAYTLDHMRTHQNKSAFQKVGESLYRYSSNGVYYARFESGGKEIRRSLRTTDRASAQRALAWLKQEREQIDPAQGKLTLGELCDRYAATMQHQKPKTIERKTLIIRRIKKHWPAGRLTQVTKVKPSRVDLWISHYLRTTLAQSAHGVHQRDFRDGAPR
jgi:hypothetical protein